MDNIKIISSDRSQPHLKKNAQLRRSSGIVALSEKRQIKKIVKGLNIAAILKH